MNYHKLEDLTLRELRLYCRLYAQVRQGRTLRQIEEAGWKSPPVRNFLLDLEGKLRAAEVFGEDESLVDRRKGNRSTSPTKHGHAFFDYAFEVLCAHERAGIERQDRENTLVLCAEPTAATYVLPVLLGDYLADSDFRHVRVTERSAPEVVDAVGHGVADLGVAVEQPRHRDLGRVRCEPLYAFDRTLVVAGRSDLPAEVRPAELARERLLTFPSSDLQALDIAELLPEPKAPGVRVYLDSTQTILEWVRRGLGVGMGTNVLAMHNGVRPVRLAGQATLVSGRVMLYAGAANVPDKVEKVRTAMLAAAGKVKLAGRADR